MKPYTSIDINAITKEAREVAFAAASLFGAQHHYKLDNKYGEYPHLCPTTGSNIVHGFFNSNLDHVELSKMVIGRCVRDVKRLPHTTPLSLSRLLKQSFAGQKCWVARDVCVSTKEFIDPINTFLLNYGEYVDVFAGIYENDSNYTNVFGIVIMLKDAKGDKRLTWEITFDDAYLEFSNVPKTAFA